MRASVMFRLIDDLISNRVADADIPATWRSVYSLNSKLEAASCSWPGSDTEQVEYMRDKRQIDFGPSCGKCERFCMFDTFRRWHEGRCCLPRLSDQDPESGPAVPEEYYEVEKILAERKTKEGIEYRVHWKNYSLAAATWEPAHNVIESAAEALKIYKSSKKRKIKEVRDANKKKPRKEDPKEAKKPPKKRKNALDSGTEDDE